MLNKQGTNEEQNFWVSYADLMAGLLFVFILVLGAILIKYITIQDNLSGQNDLVDSLNLELSTVKKSLDKEKENNKNILILLEKTNNTLTNTKANLVDVGIALKNESDILKDTDSSLKKSKIKISKLEDLIVNYKLQDDSKTKIITNLKNKVIDKSNTISLGNKETTRLESIILIQERKHKSLISEFNIAKSKIKTLTGIRVKVIRELKQKLGNSINIDNKSGAIRFYSNILFDQGKFKLKAKSKKILSKTLKKYIKTILYNQNIRKHIDKIIIEGHTNTDGSYLHNLELSQKRALEVMKFLYSIKGTNKKLLEKYVSASGRSYSNIIKKKNKKENKNASRRIEIKFQLKNEQSIKQLSKYFDKRK